MSLVLIVWGDGSGIGTDERLCQERLDTSFRRPPTVGRGREAFGVMGVMEERGRYRRPFQIGR
jgi:hypothetical protein